MSKCLYCYKELEPGEVDFHKSCCKKFFGTHTAPSLDYTRAQMDELAAQVIRSQTTLTGVQPKRNIFPSSEISSTLTYLSTPENVYLANPFFPS